MVTQTCLQLGRFAVVLSGHDSPPTAVVCISYCYFCGSTDSRTLVDFLGSLA